MIIKDIIERLVSPNRDPHTIPVLDGPLSPNTLLDAATPIGPMLDEADDFLIVPEGFLVSSREGVSRLQDGEAQLLLSTPAAAGALAALPDGSFVVAIDGRGVLAFDAGGKELWRLNDAAGQPLRAVTAMTTTADGALLIAHGSVHNDTADWQSDLMQANAPSGRVLQVGTGGKDARVLATGLAWPAGVLPAQDGRIWVTESWAHRLLLLDASSRVVTPVIGNFTGYPGRLAAADDGFLMNFMALRTELTEFVLKERAFCERMLTQVPREFWIGPALGSRGDHLAPTQIGGIKKLGIEKAWAPPRSYGLVAMFDRHGEAISSMHSRVAGSFHGITSVRAGEAGLFAVSRGEGQLAALPKAELRAERGAA